MAQYSKKKIKDYLDDGNNGATNAAKGRAFEDLVCYIFEKISGVEITQRNEFNYFDTQEIDIAVWNNKLPKGLNFLPHIILVECKNWENPVSSIEVNWFASKLQRRGLDFGILVANNGITGSNVELGQAHSIIANHLEQGRKILVITTDELLKLTSPGDFVKLIKRKLCVLTVSGNLA